MAEPNTVISGTINVFGFTVNTLQELGRGDFRIEYRGSGHSGNVVPVKKVAIKKMTERKPLSKPLNFFY